MQVSDNQVVSFHYTLFNEAGEAVESSLGGEPSLYLHGANNIMPGLETELKGHGVGDSLSVTLPPHQGYGMRRDNMTQRVPAKYLKHEGKLKPGQVVRIHSDDGAKAATVIKVGKFSVDVDSNHPLAGQTIRFDIEIVDIRQASDEEVAHGHAHGPGGHQH